MMLGARGGGEIDDRWRHFCIEFQRRKNIICGKDLGKKSIQLTNSLVGLLVGFPIIVFGQSNTHCDIIT